MIIMQCLQDFTTSYGLPVSLFLGGLVGGFTHCAGMCGAFVLAQGGAKGEAGPSVQRAQSPAAPFLLPYHLGRMTTYVILAVLVNAVINMAFIFSDMKALIAVPLLMLAATIFLVSAFPQMSAIFPWAGRMQISVPFQWISKSAGNLMGDSRPLSRYGLGVLLGFMPCGLVAAALLAAATAATPVMAALSTMAFAVGTMPALFLVGLGGTALRQKFPAMEKYLTKGAMALSSLWLFALAGFILTDL